MFASRAAGLTVSVATTWYCWQVTQIFNCKVSSTENLNSAIVKIVVIFIELMTLWSTIKSSCVSSWTYLTLSLSGLFFFHIDHKNALHLLLNWAQTSHFGVCSNHSSQEHLTPGRRSQCASKTIQFSFPVTWLLLFLLLFLLLLLLFLLRWYWLQQNMRLLNSAATANLQLRQT